jgi:hypothetical protein
VITYVILRRRDLRVRKKELTAIGFAMALVDDDVVNSRLRMRREEEEEDLMKFLRVDKKVVRASERTQTRKDIVMWIVC